MKGFLAALLISIVLCVMIMCLVFKMNPHELLSLKLSFSDKLCLGIAFIIALGNITVMINGEKV